MPALVVRLPGRNGGMATAPREGGRLLGELLIERGVASPGQVQAALRTQRRDHRPLGELLTEAGIAEAQVIGAVAEQLGVTPIDFEALIVDEDLVHSLDAGFVREHSIFPLYNDAGGRTHVATGRHLDEQLRATIAERLEAPVVLELAEPLALQRALNRHYTVLTRVGPAVQRAVLERGGVEVGLTKAFPLAADAPVVQIVELLLTQGLRDRVSDIHIEPQADRLRVRYRVDGALRDVQSLPRELGRPIASRLKIMAGMDIVDRHRSQDGQVAMELDGRAVDIRVATMETVWGEKVVLRILDRSRSLVPLRDLGLEESDHQRLKRLIGSPYGLLVVSGPTGAGKTTTLYAALNELDRSTKNITTIEDPVEYQFSNINQIQINRLAGTTFANGLRAILRQDPDVVLIGEVRDVETAEIAIQAALTGHLVLCSMHAADTVGAIYRFLDMGIESFLVASAMLGVVAQRLVRTVCTRCTAPTTARGDEVEFYRAITGEAPAGEMKAGVGCVRCGDTGFFDRTGVFECLQADDTMRELVASRATHSQLRDHAIATGMRTLQQAACDLVDAGQTTIAEVMRTVYLI